MNPQLKKSYQSLFAASDAFYAAHPWITLAEELPFHVRHSGTGELSIAISMGGSGMVRGLAVYAGHKGRAAYAMAMAMAQDPEVAEAIHPNWQTYFMHALNLEFVDATDKSPHTRALHKELGLRFRGSLRHPVASWFGGGNLPHEELSEDEVRHLTECVEAITFVARLPKEEIDKLYKRYYDHDKYLLLSPSGNDWIIEDIDPGPVEQYAMLPTAIVPPVRLAKPRKKDSYLQLGIICLPLAGPVDDPNDPPAYFPMLVIAVDFADGTIMGHQLLNPADLSEDLGEWFVGLVSELAPVHQQIVVSDEPTAHLLLPLAQRYNFELYPQPEHHGIRTLMDSMAQMLPGMG